MDPLVILDDIHHKQAPLSQREMVRFVCRGSSVPEGWERLGRKQNTLSKHSYRHSQSN